MTYAFIGLILGLLMFLVSIKNIYQDSQLSSAERFAGIVSALPVLPICVFGIVVLWPGAPFGTWENASILPYRWPIAIGLMLYGIFTFAAAPLLSRAGYSLTLLGTFRSPVGWIRFIGLITLIAGVVFTRWPV